eukprot:TRINITY_DN60036_c0_g1_i1.p1 TRINITY_DN60036_c0_g1~~TRINITY_DN60036_c0_g1_i1.p1  ORF type:complete len:595 (-),score=187.51 TRINITY_DN60036_c0_g1_i1:354-2138(-)
MNQFTTVLKHVNQFTGARGKMSELFGEWLATPETQTLFQQQLRDLQQGKELKLPRIASSHGVLSPSKAFKHFSPPRSPSSRSPHAAKQFAEFLSSPQSPSKTPRSFMPNASPLSIIPRSPETKAQRLARISKRAEEQEQPVIPQFYFPGEGGRGRGGRIPGDSLNRRMGDIRESILKIISLDIEGNIIPNVILNDDSVIYVSRFGDICKELCGYPSYFAVPLFRRIRVLFGADLADIPPGGYPSNLPEPDVDEGYITFSMFKNFWKQEIEPYDIVDRYFRLIKQPDAKYVVFDDFKPYLEELLLEHPGLRFLDSHPEFQEKYAITVITRIFYNVNVSRTMYMSQREFRKSTLTDTLMLVDEEEDINSVTDCFSYEHFYVIYCKFWELDSDHNFLLSPQDMTRHNSYSLNKPIIERIFSGSAHKLACPKRGFIGFQDFIYFLLAEEDKGTEMSLKYWFRCLDIDGDGVLSPYELKRFYIHQQDQMRALGQEVISFEDVLVQMTDLLKPTNPGYFEFKDFIHADRIRMAGTFFDIMFNLTKFIAYEQRDPFLLKQQQAMGFSAWDLYANYEYHRLADEEVEADEEVDGWSSKESPF